MREHLLTGRAPQRRALLPRHGRGTELRVPGWLVKSTGSFPVQPEARAREVRGGESPNSDERRRPTSAAVPRVPGFAA